MYNSVVFKINYFLKDFENKKNKDDVLNIDIASTILKKSGLPIPKEIENYYYNGYWDNSIKIKTRPYIYMEVGSIIGVINNNVKIVHYLDREYCEFYDLSKDPQERKNLWDVDYYKDVKLNSFDILLNNIYRAVPKWSIIMI